MRKFLIILTVIFASPYIASSQFIYPIQFDDCETPVFFLEGTEIYAQYDDDQLLDDIISGIDEDVLEKIMGAIYIQVFIDSLGNHCCMSIKNELKGKGKKVDFKKIVDNNTKWSPPTREGENANVSAMIKIVFDADRIYLMRLGFNGKVGWSELTETWVDRN